MPRALSKIRSLFIALCFVLLAGTALVAAQEKVEISVLLDPTTLGLEYMDWLENEWIPQFERDNPDIKVSTTRLSGNRLDTVAVAVAAGLPWDIVPAAHTLPMIEGVGLGWYLPLNAYIEQWDDAEYMIPTVWEHSTWNGEILALPHSLPPRFIAYNKRLFRESGLDPERPPTSWEELIAVARLLTVTTEDTLVRRGYHMPTGSNGDMAGFFELFGKNAGGRMLTEDYRRPRFTEPWGLETLNFMIELHQVTNPVGYAHNLTTSANASIYRGEAAMAMATGGAVPINVASTYYEVVDLGVFLPRRSPDHRPVSTSSINSMAIMRFTKHPDEAWRVLAHLYSREALMEFSKIRGQVVPRSDLFADVAAEVPEIMVLYELLDYVVPRPKWPSGAGYTYTTGLGEPVRLAVLGEMPPEAALEEARRRVQLLLDDFWQQ